MGVCEGETERCSQRREEDLSVWFRRFSSERKTNRDSENLPDSQGSGPLGSAVLVCWFFREWRFGSQISEVMSRPEPRRCVAVQGPE